MITKYITKEDMTNKLQSSGGGKKQNSTRHLVKIMMKWIIFGKVDFLIFEEDLSSQNGNCRTMIKRKAWFLIKVVKTKP